jgi:hypothetical protein
MRASSIPACVAVLAIAVSAMGGTLAGDPNPLVSVDPFDNTAKTWQGTTVLSDGDEFSVTVDWLVVAADNWTYDGYTPTADPNYPSYETFVYAYQVWCTGSDDLVRFWISMLDSNEARAIGTFTVDADDSSAVLPDTATFSGTPIDAANWTWGDEQAGGLATGQHSVGLVYSSVNLPTLSPFAMGHIHDGGSSASAMLPSPSNVIPEPATIALLGLGAVAALRRRRK